MDFNGDVTLLLRAWHQGDAGALDALMETLYPMLHGLASGQLRQDRRGHTLQPTALVNEAFFRLVKAGQVAYQDRNHFLAIAARLMRQVLVDHARLRGYQKRGGGAERVPLESADPAEAVDVEDALTVHLALDALARRDDRKAQVVELRFFGGLSVEETAAVLGISVDSVHRDWRLAKAWLLQHISEAGSGV